MNISEELYDKSEKLLLAVKRQVEVHDEFRDAYDRKMTFDFKSF